MSYCDGIKRTVPSFWPMVSGVAGRKTPENPRRSANSISVLYRAEKHHAYLGKTRSCGQVLARTACPPADCRISAKDFPMFDPKKLAKLSSPSRLSLISGELVLLRSCCGSPAEICLIVTVVQFLLDSERGSY